MKLFDTDNPQRTNLILLLATVVLVPVWLWLIPWGRTEYSGWAALAQLYPAGDRPLVRSVGRVTVALDAPGRPRIEFTFSNQSGGVPDVVYIEAGFDESGFWLRSTRADPQPPIYVPWQAVEHCELYGYRLKGTTTRVLVFEESMLQHCTAVLSRR